MQKKRHDRSFQLSFTKTAKQTKKKRDKQVDNKKVQGSNILWLKLNNQYMLNLNNFSTPILFMMTIMLTATKA